MSQNDGRFMAIAFAESRHADCLGQKVGAVLVTSGGALITAGHNGTPKQMIPCMAGGCLRCARREELGPGLYYDMCVCVHAEQIVLLACARFGASALGHVLYTTLKPCLGCCKELLAAGISEVVYSEDWELRMPEFADDHNQMLRLLRARQLPKEA